MTIRIVSVWLLMLVGSYANAATVLVGNGISWTTSITGVGTNTGTITLNADVSGSTFSTDVYLGAIGIKSLGESSDASHFLSTSVQVTNSVSLVNWEANNAELNGSPVGSACDGGDGSSDNRACAFASAPGDRPSTADGNLSIVLGVTLDPGDVLSDTYHLKVRWEDMDGNKQGSLISDDISQVPLPAAAWLFGSALMGLTVVARRRDLKNRPVA